MNAREAGAAGKMDMPAQRTTLPLCFSSLGASVARVMPAPVGEGACLYSVLTAKLSLRHLTDTPRSDAVPALQHPSRCL